ncbi:hypothetical protein M9458_019609, partial [Cirrhinus mrigala]
LRLYAFPPIALLLGVLERVRRDGVHLLVAPYWPARAWFSDLISLLDGSPWEIPARRDLLSQAGGPVNCPVGTVLEFLQVRFSAGLAHSILKVYVVAFLACHAPLGGSSVGRNPLVTVFLHGALRPLA